MNYPENNDARSSPPVDIKCLWRWVKFLIKTTKVNSEPIVSIIPVSPVPKDNPCPVCEEQIKDYKLSSNTEIKGYITGLLEKNKRNQVRIEQLKNLLLVGKFLFFILF